MSAKLPPQIPIQIVSDLHLETHRNWPRISPTAPYLFLAGDIGNIHVHRSAYKLRQFLRYCSENWTTVFYVMGNHEFYQGWPAKNIGTAVAHPPHKKTFAQIVHHFKTKLVAHLPRQNVHILCDEAVELVPGVSVYGSTLWTRGYSAASTAQFNDYYCITTGPNGAPLDHAFVAALSAEQERKLTEYLDQTRCEKPEHRVIVLSHFPPTRRGTSDPILARGNDADQAAYFAWDNLHHKVGAVDASVIAWISGHTHWSHDFMTDDGDGDTTMPRLLSNQCGHRHERRNHYRDDQVFYIATQPHVLIRYAAWIVFGGGYVAIVLLTLLFGWLQKSMWLLGIGTLFAGVWTFLLADYLERSSSCGSALRGGFPRLSGKSRLDRRQDRRAIGEDRLGMRPEIGAEDSSDKCAGEE